MRVLMTTDTVGGVWTFTQELVAGLLEENCSVVLVSVGRQPSPEQWDWAVATERVSKSFEFHSSPVPLEWMQENDRSLTEAAPLLLELATGRNVDVLHSNQFCFGALPLPMPKVITAHSDVLTWAEQCRESPLEETPWMQRYRTLVRQGLGGADAVVAPTRWMLASLGRHFLVPRKSCVILNGRDIQISGHHGSRKLQAVTAGRLWDEAKGISLLQDVSSPMPLLVAGDTQCESSSAPQALGNANLLGALSQSALLQVFQQSAIYICMSRYEPFGLAPLEAALCGCAVVANDLPSLREVWGEGALYFQGATSLSNLLQSLSADPHLLAQAQERSFARARPFSRAAMAASYLDLYRSLTQPTEAMADVA